MSCCSLKWTIFCNFSSNLAEVFSKVRLRYWWFVASLSGALTSCWWFVVSSLLVTRCCLSDGSIRVQSKGDSDSLVGKNLIFHTRLPHRRDVRVRMLTSLDTVRSLRRSLWQKDHWSSIKMPAPHYDTSKRRIITNPVCALNDVRNTSSNQPTKGDYLGWNCLW